MLLAISRNRESRRHFQELHDAFSRTVFGQDDRWWVMTAEITQDALVGHEVHKMPRE